MQTRRNGPRGAALGRTSAAAQGVAKDQAGFTLVEVMVAVLVLVIAITGISGSMLSAMALNRVNRDTAVAQQAARLAMEELSGRPFSEVFAIYNSNPGDVTAGMPEFGPNFAVFGLNVADGDPDGMCGRIVFPTMTIGAIEELREDVVDADLGVPRDLDGDGVWPELANQADGYVLLPVRVLVEWRGLSGPRSIELETMLSER
jgi:prepilin-type N-terminal cleavage/methylation domain-containing protein